MQNISSAAELKNAIQLLEAEQADKGRLLREQLNITFESLKPANLIASTLNDIAKSPFLVDNILGAAVGLVTGFYSQKLMLNPSGNKLKKLMGTVLQFGVTNLVARHQGTLRAIGAIIFRRLTRKKRLNSVQP